MPQARDEFADILFVLINLASNLTLSGEYVATGPNTADMLKILPQMTIAGLEVNPILLAVTEPSYQPGDSIIHAMAYLFSADSSVAVRMLFDVYHEGSSRGPGLQFDPKELERYLSGTHTLRNDSADDLQELRRLQHAILHWQGYRLD